MPKVDTVTFNPTAAGDYVRDLLAERGEGAQSELARHLGVSVPSVNRWATRKNQPDPAYWPAIERFFELSPGTLTVVALGGPQSPEFLAVLRSTLPLIDSSDEPGAERLRVAVLAAVEELQRSLDAVSDGAG